MIAELFLSLCLTAAKPTAQPEAPLPEILPCEKSGDEGIAGCARKKAAKRSRYMAALSEAKRIEVWREVMDDLSRASEPVGAITKVELRAALDAADDWVEANKAAFNAALPAAAQAGLTAAQKSRLLNTVVKRRFQEGE